MVVRHLRKTRVRVFLCAVIGAAAMVGGGSGYFRPPPRLSRCTMPGCSLRLRGGQEVALDEEVARTLQAMGLAHWHARFAQENIRARNLPDLTAEDLAEMVRVWSLCSSFQCRPWILCFRTAWRRAHFSVQTSGSFGSRDQYLHSAWLCAAAARADWDRSGFDSARHPRIAWS